MTYKELLIKLSGVEEFDPMYTIKHLTVDECFKSSHAEGKNWHDIADKESIQEATNL